MDNSYICAICCKVFNKKLTDEEAEEQFQQEFPGEKLSDCVIVCEDCFIDLGYKIDKDNTDKKPR